MLPIVELLFDDRWFWNGGRRRKLVKGGYCSWLCLVVSALETWRRKERNRSYWEQVKRDPRRHERRKQSAREGMRKLRAQKKAMRLGWILNT